MWILISWDNSDLRYIYKCKKMWMFEHQALLTRILKISKKLKEIYIIFYVVIIQNIIKWIIIVSTAAAAAAESLQSCPTLCDSIDSSSPGSSVPGILQARTLQWVANSFSMHESEKWKWKWKVKVKSYPTLSDPMDCSLPGSSIDRIFQARVLEWGAIAFTMPKTLTVWITTNWKILKEMGIPPEKSVCMSRVNS